MKFVLIIDTDNPCIGHGRNVARALERVVHDLDKKYPMEDGIIKENNKGVVLAIDSSVIGRWEIDK